MFTLKNTHENCVFKDQFYNISLSIEDCNFKYMVSDRSLQERPQRAV